MWSAMMFGGVCLLVLSSLVFVFGDTPELCSVGCKKRDVVLAEGGEITYQCSCSSSCEVYKDCCYDSEFRNKVSKRPELPRWPTKCLSVSNMAAYRVVAKCARKWPKNDTSCRDAFGHQPPVTSTKTGITYANIFCAACNDDADDYHEWKVQMKCCKDDKNLDGKKNLTLYYSKERLWSRETENCECLFHIDGNDSSFLDGLELRKCSTFYETSKCSQSWTDSAVSNLCNGPNSFKDPVYLEHKVYKNKHCAICNYEHPDNIKCFPKIVEKLRSDGLTDNEIKKECLRDGDSACLNYYEGIFGKGGSQPLSALFRHISVSKCVPPKGRLCCTGQSYDFKEQVCRKVKRK